VKDAKAIRHMYREIQATNAANLRTQSQKAPVARYHEQISDNLFAFMLLVILLGASVRAFYVLAVGLGNPLLDMHAFRQTQTALSVYWLVHGGPWVHYETPVLGAPWSIPFEFPLFQWLVSLVAEIGVPIDAAGRIVAFSFYLAILWPLYVLFRALRLGRVAFLATAILFMTAPMYLYWSRTFLVESCALFFSVLALAFLAVYIRDARTYAAAAAALAGIAATLVKATTFPAFAVIGGCLILLNAGMRLQHKGPLAAARWAIIPSLIITLPFMVGYAWLYYCDQVKSANEFGQLITSAHLALWNFGSLDQRLSKALWTDTIQNRVLSDLFGPAVPVAFIALGATLLRPHFAAAAALAALGFLLPFLIFTNVHVVHNYYQYANGVFALAAAGLGVASLAAGGRLPHYVMAGGVLIAVLTGQVLFFKSNFEPYVLEDDAQSPLFKAAQFIKYHTPPDSSILVFGDDWSSAVPYYAERKALAVPGWTPSALIDRVIADPQPFLGDRSLGAIVVCRDQRSGYTDRVAAIEQFATEHSVVGEFGGCKVLAGKS
jgi:hypothetical protein